ncbi:RusA family crossover junction endodeoxyribonuclease [Microbacterium xylanilyticum]
MRSITFTARGLPAPQGSKTYKGHRGGHAILGESSKKVAPWRQDVVAAAAAEIRNHPGWTPIAAGVELLIEFYMPRPTGHPKTRRTIPDVTPDLDKLIRSTCDALKTAGVYADDARVVEVSARKRYAVVDSTIGLDHEMVGTGAIITVSELHPDASWADGKLIPLLMAPVLPPAVHRAIRWVEQEEWAPATGVLTVTASMTDAKAVALLGQAAKRGAVVAVEDGAIRLASIPGKPLDRLQEAVVDYGQLVDIVLTVAAENTRAEDTAVRA